MNKSEIVERIQTATGLSRKDSAEMLEFTFSAIKDTLESGESLKISGFGSFTVKQKADRRGRNPQSGEEIIIKARRVLSFKPSMSLRQAINGPEK